MIKEKEEVNLIEQQAIEKARNKAYRHLSYAEEILRKEYDRLNFKDRILKAEETDLYATGDALKLLEVVMRMLP